MRNLLCLFLLCSFIISCKTTSKSSPIASSSSNHSEIGQEVLILEHNIPSSSPSSDDTPSFRFYTEDGDSTFNGGDTFQVFLGANCQNLLVSDSINSFSTYVYFTVAISEPGTYQFSAKHISIFGAESECSNAITYELTAPSPPTSASLLSEASPSTNPNPKISLAGMGFNDAEIYLTNDCSGDPIATPSNSNFILPALINGTYSIYAKTVTENGIKSECSAELLEYQSLNTSTLDSDLDLTPFYATEEYLLDSDAYEDYVTFSTYYVYIGHGNSLGESEDRSTIYTGGTVGSLLVDDIDLDGDKDILVGNDWLDLYLLVNNGDRTFTKTSFQSLGYSSFANVNSIEFVDVDGDGHKDIIIAINRDNDIFKIISNGDGTYQSHVDLIPGTPINSFALADFNQDGHSDVISRGAGNIKVYENDGTGGFTLALTETTAITYGEFEVKDMNSDNYPDIVLADYPEGVDIHLNNTSSGFNSPISVSLIYNDPISDLKIVDIDADNDFDVILQSSGNYVYKAVYLGDNSGNLTPSLIYPSY